MERGLTTARQCLLDAYTVTECPNCSKNILTVAPDGTQQVLCSVNNEGGFQADEDILPLLSEEGYLKAYPEERKSRAFLEFCRQGDIHAIVTMLQNNDEDEDDEDDEDTMQEGNQIDLLRYQDPLGDMQSPLHAAVVGLSREVAWLLLLLASNLDLQEFPERVLHEAEAAGFTREDQQGKVDIRSIRNAHGQSAEQLASELGDIWQDWIGTQRLAL